MSDAREAITADLRAVVLLCREHVHPPHQQELANRLEGLADAFDAASPPLWLRSLIEQHWMEPVIEDVDVLTREHFTLWRWLAAPTSREEQ
jgi:hypothetical protein